MLHDLKRASAGNAIAFFESLKAKVIEFYPDDKTPGLTTNQIIRFMYELKRGDLIIIPSENSRMLTFGVVSSDLIPELSEHALSISGCPYRKRKNVNWVKTVRRADMDPYLFKMLQAHQAISNISNYAELIERTLRDFYILNDEVNLVLDVTSQNDIGAIELFGFGYNLMLLVEEYAKENNITVDVGSVQVKTYLNSPGKVNFKSICKNSLVIAAGLLFLCGGGYENGKVKLKTDGLPALIKSISDFLDSRHDRQVQDKLIQASIDSLGIHDSDNFNKVMKQAARNKDLPK
ncbi:hypothetical protein PV783_24770 [Chitinophaga sp. CC14]|uniref:hypothetical protein n=1 Tax=Chitinophaga sp. CC14 TaxID=3029199 RepID=UPI003B7A214B